MRSRLAVDCRLSPFAFVRKEEVTATDLPHKEVPQFKQPIYLSAGYLAFPGQRRFPQPPNCRQNAAPCRPIREGNANAHAVSLIANRRESLAIWERRQRHGSAPQRDHISRRRIDDARNLRGERLEGVFFLLIVIV